MSLSVARNHMPVRPRNLPVFGPAKNSSPFLWARVGSIGRIAETSSGSRSSPAKRKVTKALRSDFASVFVVEVAKRLALVIGHRTVRIYNYAVRPRQVARCFDLVQSAAEMA